MNNKIWSINFSKSSTKGKNRKNKQNERDSKKKKNCWHNRKPLMAEWMLSNRLITVPEMWKILC